MSRCAHRGSRWDTMGMSVEGDNFTTRPVRVDICSKCGHWLSLGPANDTPPEVQVEMRAAELAANDGPIRTCSNSMPADCEECGWDCWPFLTAMHDASPAQWSGYLARCIATHGENNDGM